MIFLVKKGKESLEETELLVIETNCWCLSWEEKEKQTYEKYTVLKYVFGGMDIWILLYRKEELLGNILKWILILTAIDLSECQRSWQNSAIYLLVNQFRGNILLLRKYY